MDWLTADNIKSVLALAFMVYAAALVIVKLTPTPKDDEALEEVSKILRFVARLFGLDIHQGVNKPNANGGTGKALSVLLACCLLAGCAQSLQQIHKDPRAEVVLANKTFAVTVSGLADLRASGIINKELALKIDPIIQEGAALLFDWQSAILEGRNQPGAWDELQLILARLAALEAQAQARKEKK